MIPFNGYISLGIFGCGVIGGIVLFYSWWRRSATIRDQFDVMIRYREKLGKIPSKQIRLADRPHSGFLALFAQTKGRKFKDEWIDIRKAASSSGTLANIEDATGQLHYIEHNRLHEVFEAAGIDPDTYDYHHL